MSIRASITVALLGLLSATHGVVAKDFAATSDEEVMVLQQRLYDSGCYSGAFDRRRHPALEAAIKACPSQEPILVIETGMHAAPIERISVDAACHLLVTGSQDKTVRLWSLPEGRLLRTQRLPIDQGDLGKVNAVAVSPDGRHIAAGGWDAIWKAEKPYGVYLFDSASGTQVRHIGAFPDVVLHLAFSPDGKRLAVALGGEGIRVLDVETGNLLMADDDYASSTNGVTFARNGTLYAVGYDGYLRLYGLDLKRKFKTATPGGKRPFSVAVDPTGQRLAVGYSDPPVVDIFDASSLRHISTAETRNFNNRGIVNLTWSADGRYLFGAGDYSILKNKTRSKVVRRWSVDGRQLGADTPVADTTVKSLATCADAIVFGATDSSFGLLHADGTVKKLGQTRIPDMRGKLAEAFSVSANGTRLRFGLGYGNNQPILFDLARGIVAAASAPKADLHPADINGLKVNHWKNESNPTLDDKPIQIDKSEKSSSLAVRADRMGFVLGTQWFLRGFAANGSERWEQEVPGTVWGVNLARNGELVIAACDDGTVRWHRWSDGKELLALFVRKDGKRWIAWTPTGYYMASAGADELIGWHVNRGWQQPADFFSIAYFRNQLNRPDIVRLMLETLDEPEAIKRANQIAKRPNLSESILALQPPVIHFIKYSNGGRYSVTSDIFQFDYELRSPSGRKATRIDFLIDRRLHKSFSGSVQSENATQAQRGTLTVTGLPHRKIDVALIAWSGKQGSKPARIKLIWSGPRR